MSIITEVRDSSRYLPAVVACSLTFVILYLNSFSDQLFVNLCGPVAAKAYSIAIPVSLTILGIAGIFGMCAAAAVRYHLDQGNIEEANESACNSLVYSTILGLALSTVLYSGFILLVMMEDVDREVVNSIILFLLPFVVFFVAIVCNSILCSLMIIDGGTKASVICLLVTFLSNIAFDRYFVNVLDWGIFGNGLGSAVSYSISLFVALVWFSRNNGRIRLSRKYLALSRSGFRKTVSHHFHRVIKLLATNGSEVVLRISLYMSYALSYGVPMLCAGMANVISSGCTPALGPRYRELASKGDVDGAMSLFRGSALCMFLTMCGFTAIVYILSDPLVDVFTQVPGLTESHDVIVWTLHVLCFTAPFLGLRGVCAAAISPYGGTVEDTITIIIWCLVRIVLFLYFLGVSYQAAIYFLLLERSLVGIHHLGYTWRFVGRAYRVPTEYE